MAAATKDKEETKETPKEVKEEKKDPILLTLEDIREHCRLLERSVVSTESRFAGNSSNFSQLKTHFHHSFFPVRVLRGLPATRKKLNNVVMRKVVAGFYTHSASAKEALMTFVHNKDDMDVDDTPIRLRGAKSANNPLLPEVDAYLHLLVLLYLIDNGKKDQAVQCSDQLMVKLSGFNRRSLDHVAGRCYYYHTLSHEAKGQMAQIRGFLHGKLRTATLNVRYAISISNCFL